MHNRHGDIHEIGLQDDCAACQELADNPYSNMDHIMLHNLIQRNLEYRFTNILGVSPRTYVEAAAMVNITNVMEKMGKLFESNCYAMQTYLLKQWDIDLERH